MAKLDNKTAELPGLPALPKKRGRPATGKAKTAAQRMSESRARSAERDRGRIVELDAAIELVSRSRKAMLKSSPQCINDGHMQHAYSMLHQAETKLNVLKSLLTASSTNNR